ncbi:MAG: aldehyde ferredoxin oxidoreductase family protein [Coriobacteriia bacterium]|nr:aldehyde ferredoxin oxidoreductase family protein [Coriobacteriia bacterium]
MSGGWAGHVLHIDLTSSSVREYPWSTDERRAFVGGKVMAAKILYDLLEPGCDPLGPANVVVISTGPLTGSGAPSTSRFNVSSLSPLTGIVASSNCGGPFGVYLKKAGVDALVITGAASEPVWLEVREEGVEFHPAASVWGLTTSATQSALAAAVSTSTPTDGASSSTPTRCGTLVIGPAGENAVRYAALLSGERAAGRAGLGAVLGAKNLKGLAAHGSQHVPLADPQRFSTHIKAWTSTLKAHPLTGKLLPAYGTGGLLPEMQELGIVATSNYRRGRFDGASELSGQRMADTRLTRTSGCMSCPIRCARVVEVDGRSVKGPELETLVLMGSNLENPDLDFICRANVLLDDLGMDTMTTGVTLSLAMELAEQGVADFPVRFGSTDGLLDLLSDIAYRRRFGAELADGSRALGARYKASDYAMHVKGLELAAYEPRGAFGHALGYATSNRGGCHLNGGYMVALEGLGLDMKRTSTRGKPALTAMFQDLMEAVSATGTCLFTTYAVLPGPVVRHKRKPLGHAVTAALSIASGPLALLRALPSGMLAIPMPLIPHIRAIELATGERWGFGGFWQVGRRGFALERELALRFGVTAADDTLPGRSLTENLEPGNPGRPVPIADLTRAYYRHRGWDAAGRPKASLLRRLGLKDARAHD